MFNLQIALNRVKILPQMVKVISNPFLVEFQWRIALQLQMLSVLKINRWWTGTFDPFFSHRQLDHCLLCLLFLLFYCMWWYWYINDCGYRESLCHRVNVIGSVDYLIMDIIRYVCYITSSFSNNVDLFLLSCVTLCHVTQLYGIGWVVIDRIRHGES